MRYKNKINILFIIFALIFSSCANKQNEKNTYNFISYCAVEKTNENYICFNYPLFNDLKINANEINELIIIFIESILQNRFQLDFRGNMKGAPEIIDWKIKNYSDLIIDVNYTIIKNNDNYFCVIFEGLYNCKKSPHPTHIFLPLIIDIKNIKTVILNDLYKTDDDFINILRDEISNQINIGLANRIGCEPEDIPDDVVELIVNDINDEHFFDQLININNNFLSGTSYFLTDDGLGISISVPYVLGDHFEVIIEYNKLSSYLI